MQYPEADYIVLFSENRQGATCVLHPRTRKQFERGSPRVSVDHYIGAHRQEKGSLVVESREQMHIVLNLLTGQTSAVGRMLVVDPVAEEVRYTYDYV